MILTDTPEVSELCHRLHRETSANAVLVCGPEGEILGHAGSPGSLDDEALDAVADCTVEVLRAGASGSGGGSGNGEGAATEREAGELDDHVRRAGPLHLCAAPLGGRAVLVVVFDNGASLTLVRLRMRRARELILRSLEVG